MKYFINKDLLKESQEVNHQTRLSKTNNINIQLFYIQQISTTI